MSQIKKINVDFDSTKEELYESLGMTQDELADDQRIQDEISSKIEVVAEIFQDTILRGNKIIGESGITSSEDMTNEVKEKLHKNNCSRASLAKAVIDTFTPEDMVCLVISSIMDMISPAQPMPDMSALVEMLSQMKGEMPEKEQSIFQGGMDDSGKPGA